MDLKAKLPLMLAQRYKRLRYLQEKFQNIDPSKTLNETELKEAQSLLETYALLISKEAKSSTVEELNETEGRLGAIERQLTAMFDLRRLATSNLGAMAVGAGPSSI